MLHFSDKFNLLGYLVTLQILFGCSAIDADSEWNGKWFPHRPDEDDPLLDGHNSIEVANNNNNNIDSSYTKKMKTMGISDPSCDDAERNLWIDYDPKNITHHSRFICMQNRKQFEPNTTVNPILREYTIPVEYTALHRCMNESISYDYVLPTFGTHRPVWPIYGEYIYVPVQRWLHNLEHGAIVAAYHPCVNQRQLDEFKTLVKKCLYRHIITPYEKLEPSRPFALIAWGRSLEMSVIVRDICIGFIRMNALQGPEKISRNGKYRDDIIEQAKIVSDIDDNNLCPNM